MKKMKKILSFFLTIALCIACAFAIAGCNKSGGNRFTVYAPDGAPALSVAGIANSPSNDRFNVKVVKADTISAYVNGNSPAADFAVLPVNAAVKMLGSGEKYKMLGTVTHGNLFILKKQGGEDITTTDDLTKLVGKTVGVINLVNVPGLTFKVILNDNGIAYNELKDGASAASDKVNLLAVTAQQAIPTNSDCDYFVVSEPAASTRVAITSGKLNFAGSLQTLYGGEDGYPQAVAVVKREIAENHRDAVNAFIESFATTKQWLLSEDTSAEQIVSAVQSCIEGDMEPMFTAQNLNKNIISNCGIGFVGNENCKDGVIEFMQKFNAVSGGAWGMPADGFFL
ncbi:MAG: hypothetical protein NC131_07960 [Roseburia sp.]|nr:hypothetical protein [Roseburia sp.]